MDSPREALRRAALRALVSKHKFEYELLKEFSGGIVFRAEDKDFLEAIKSLVGSERLITKKGSFFFLPIPGSTWEGETDFILSLATSYGLRPEASRDFSFPVISFI